MRIDKFLKIMALIKRRTVANEAADEGFIYVNGKKVKPSYSINKGDILELDMWNYYKRVKILDVPAKKSVPKKDREKFIEVEEYKTREPDDIL